MTKTQKITDFRVSWTADHEQYFQGHGIAFTDYTHCATGCGETLRESFNDALIDLFEQTDMDFREDEEPFISMLAKLTSQVKGPEMLDGDIVQGHCPKQGEHTTIVTDHCDVCHELDSCNHGPECAMAHPDPDPDCAVCAGEWHYYVSIDVKVEEE